MAFADAWSISLLCATDTEGTIFRQSVSDMGNSIGEYTIIDPGQYIVMQCTRFGRASRATSDDAMAVELTSVNAKRAYVLAIMLSMGTTAVSGILIVCTYTFNASVGSSYLIIAFGVVVIGGMGSILGTLLGGVVLGVAQLLGSYFLGSGVQLLVAYIVLLIVLATRPNGLLARAARK